MQKERMEMEERMKEQERQMQKEKLETEEKERERQFNFRMKELEMQNKTVKLQPLDSGIHFDVSKHIRLVPPFQEKEVDKYFLHFEKVVENLKWPKKHSTLLLQSVITGEAQEIYTQLTVERSSNYDTVKELILKAYELVPKAYRQKFRNCKKAEVLGCNTPSFQGSPHLWWHEAIFGFNRGLAPILRYESHDKGMKHSWKNFPHIVGFEPSWPG